MAEDEDAQAGSADGAVVIAAADIGRAALLAALENERADFSGRGLLCFELLVDVALRPVEYERHERAALGADAQQLGGEAFVVGIEPDLYRILLHLRLWGFNLNVCGDAARHAFNGRGPIRICGFRPLRVGADAERGEHLRQSLAVSDFAVLDPRDELLAFADLRGQRVAGHILGNARAANVIAPRHRLGVSIPRR